MSIWYSLWSFDILYGHLAYFMAIWHTLWPFGILYGHLSTLWPFGILYYHLLYVCNLWPFSIFYGILVYISPFWYVLPRKIWQHCMHAIETVCLCCGSLFGTQQRSLILCQIHSAVARILCSSVCIYLDFYVRNSFVLSITIDASNELFPLH
jgi:hypothetical protein